MNCAGKGNYVLSATGQEGTFLMGHTKKHEGKKINFYFVLRGYSQNLLKSVFKSVFV
jgi:hypothetical protein